MSFYSSMQKWYLCITFNTLKKLVSAQHLGRGLPLLATYRACPIWMKCKVESSEWHITRPTTCRMNGLFWAGMMQRIPMLFFLVHQRYKQHSAYVISKISWSLSIDKKEKNCYIIPALNDLFLHKPFFVYLVVICLCQASVNILLHFNQAWNATPCSIIMHTYCFYTHLSLFILLDINIKFILLLGKSDAICLWTSSASYYDVAGCLFEHKTYDGTSLSSDVFFSLFWSIDIFFFFQQVLVALSRLKNLLRSKLT